MGAHDLEGEPVKLKQWGASDWEKYRVIGRCKLCGARFSTIVSHAELVRVGWDEYIQD